MGPSGASLDGIRTAAATIQDVLREFVAETTEPLPAPEARLYRHVVLFLELCINNYGHRNLDEESRELYERLYRDPAGGREFFELFGPALLLPELDFFTNVFLKTDVHTSDRVIRKAKDVADELRRWLVASGHLSRAMVEELEDRVKARERLKRRLRPLLRCVALVNADASTLPRMIPR